MRNYGCTANNRKMLGRGHIDWPSIKTALDEVDYRDWLVIETFPNPAVETGRTVNTWRPLVDDLDAEARRSVEFIRHTVA